MEGFLMRGWGPILTVGPRRWPGGTLSPRAGSMSRSQSAISQWGPGFHTVRSCIDDPGDLGLRPRVVAVVEIWEDFWSGDGIISSPCAAGPRRKR